MKYFSRRRSFNEDVEIGDIQSRDPEWIASVPTIQDYYQKYGDGIGIYGVNSNFCQK